MKKVAKGVVNKVSNIMLSKRYDFLVINQSVECLLLSIFTLIAEHFSFC